MEAFLHRYESPLLIGVDFDIEAGQTQRQIESLIRRVVVAQTVRPHLRFSFTLATHAASDGSRRSLNRLGETVLEAIRSVGLRNYTVNLMVMNYGPADSSHCVSSSGRCEMGHSARQAVENVHQRYGLPYKQLEITAMLGENDVSGNVFTLADAEMLARFARERGLAGLHYWSLDRDTPCPLGAPRVSATCSGVSAPAGTFARAFAAGIR
jgi:hypothetical protein